MDSLPWFAPPPAADSRSVLVVGAGLAGCHLAVALSEAGIPVTLIDASDTVAGEASANSRCVLRPHVVRTSGWHNRFNEQAFIHARKTLTKLAHKGQQVECSFPGALQLLRHSGHWPKLQTARAVDAAQASSLAGIRLSGPALYFANAGWVNAASYCRALIASASVYPHFKLLLGTRVLDIVRADNDHPRKRTWQLQTTARDNAETQVLQATTVVLCCGAGSRHIPQMTQLPFQLSSGQTTHCHWPLQTPKPKTVLCGKRYLIPSDSGITLGATHWRDNEQTNIDPRDDALNLSALEELLPDLVSHSGDTFFDKLVVHDNWRSLRASTPDRLPLVGALPDHDFYREAYATLHHGPRHKAWPAARYIDGLYILAGLGSRGAGTASLCAEILAAQMISEAAAESAQEAAHFAQLLHPARFLVRQLKRSPP